MDQKNVILALVLSGIIIIGWTLLQPYILPMPPARPPQQTSAPSQTPPTTAGTQGLPAAGTSGAAPELVDRDAALKQSPRVAIQTPSLRGSIPLTGGQIDDVVLANYRETVEPNSK